MTYASLSLWCAYALSIIFPHYGAFDTICVACGTSSFATASKSVLCIGTANASNLKPAALASASTKLILIPCGRIPKNFVLVGLIRTAVFTSPM
ncbi:hypothetical protein I7I48_09722 [Histoplasma ohiense]|nr:hypothetical protein I7I48_09722 [Histoplasma ohiense (nom. inval.)]